MRTLQKPVQRHLVIPFLILLLLLPSCAEDDSTFSSSSSTPTVVSTSPPDGASKIPINTSISVTFSQAIDSYVVTTNYSDIGCYGHIQVSDDEFVTCSNGG